MCILLLTTSHPDYPLIVCSNRDEFLNRPTARAAWWPKPHDDILGGMDLHREEHGTWLGISREGRFAVLLSVREEDSFAGTSPHSRGAIVSSFLESGLTTDKWIDEMLPAEGKSSLFDEVGGFSLVCGVLRPSTSSEATAETKFVALNPLSVVSNRTHDLDPTHYSHKSEIERIADSPPSVHGISNSLFTEPWPKVTNGCQLLQKTVLEDSQSKADLVESLFGVLSIDVVSEVSGNGPDAFLKAMTSTIKVPHFEWPSLGQEQSATPAGANREPQAGVIYFGAPAGATKSVAAIQGTSEPAVVSSAASLQPNKRLYGTQKQTVILVDRMGHVTYVERALWDEGQPVAEHGQDLTFEFHIKGWQVR